MYTIPQSSRHYLHFEHSDKALHVCTTPRQVWMNFRWMSTPQQWVRSWCFWQALFLLHVLLSIAELLPQMSPTHPWMTNELAFLKVHSSFRDNKNPGGLEVYWQCMWAPVSEVIYVVLCAAWHKTLTHFEKQIISSYKTIVCCLVNSYCWCTLWF